MNATMRKAIPTEFMGVRYRSKSEAQFACAWDTYFGCYLLEYEPEYLRVEGWVPDFLLIYQPPRDIGGAMWANIIELKPTTPSKTYLENIAPKIQRATEILPFVESTGEVWSGSFYKGGAFQTKRVIQCPDSGACYFEESERFEFGPETQKHVLEYRFDLKHGGNSGG